MSSCNNELLSIAENFNLVNPTIRRAELSHGFLEGFGCVQRNRTLWRPSGALKDATGEAFPKQIQNNLYCSGIVKVDVQGGGALAENSGVVSLFAPAVDHFLIGRKVLPIQQQRALTLNGNWQVAILK